MHSNVHSFRAPDVAEALAKVKAALGPEAVILATRQVAGSLFRRPEIEVTAALVVGPEPVPPQSTRRPGAPQPAADRSWGRSSTGAVALGPELGLGAEIMALKKELDEARREMRAVCLRTRAENELGLQPAAAEVFGHLVHRGVEDALAEEMVRQALFDGSRAPSLLSKVRDLLAGRLVPAPAPWLPGPRRIIALVGPTGVGKTTCTAKIAARALLEEHLRVSLITVDTYRVGGSEQLARYGRAMGVSTLVARDGRELKAAMDSASESDLVLIDSAGRAVSEAVARQAELLRSIGGVELTLVLSAASGTRELAAAAERYRRLAPERLVFSKLDEAVAPGCVLSAAVRLGRPVSCIADGQRVPEDIHAVTSEDLCELVLGGPSRGMAAARRT